MTEVNPRVVDSAALRAQNLCAALNLGGPAHLLEVVVETTIKGLQRLQHEIEQAGPDATFAPADGGRLGSLLAEAVNIPDQLPEGWLEDAAVELNANAAPSDAGLRYKLEQKPVSELRRLAGGMPYRSESKKRELIDWLVKYRPHSIDDL